MLAKFHGNTLNLSENIAKSFRRVTFFDSHCRIFNNGNRGGNLLPALALVTALV